MSAFVQDLIAVGIGLLAAAYLARRWWPSLKGLVQGAPEAPACGSSGTSTSTSASAGSCSAGCGQCGQASPSKQKDHRVHVVKRAS